MSEDIPVESGPFGELVAHGVVERDGDEYYLADPEAVRRALVDEPANDAPATADAVISIRTADGLLYDATGGASDNGARGSVGTTYRFDRGTRGR